MTRVALIQSASEMLHNGFADARGALDRLGFEHTLYTRENVADLLPELRARRFDAVLFASNALNDRVVREVCRGEEFVGGFGEFLAGHGGCVILHQLAMAREPSLGVLPAPLDTVHALKRPEPAREGDLQPGKAARHHVAMRFPADVDVARVVDAALGFRSLPGLYWHYWYGGRLADWEVLIEDRAHQPARTIAAVTNATMALRVAVCAIPVDWQGQDDLLGNLLEFAASGWARTAVLAGGAVGGAETQYLLRSLRARRLPHRVYGPEEEEQLARRLRQDIHGVLVLGSGLRPDALPGGVAAAAADGVGGGRLRMVSFPANDTHPRSFALAGRQPLPDTLLNAAQLQALGDLEEGFVEGSFWSTIEVLQLLCDLGRIDDPAIADAALERADGHDPGDGSYDETFAATCGQYWLRSWARGADHESTRRTLAWIRRELDGGRGASDEVYALGTMAERGAATGEEREALGRLLAGVTDGSTELELFVALRAARALGGDEGRAHAARLARTLVGKRGEDGLWIDLDLSAAIAGEILDHARATGEEGRALLSHADVRGALLTVMAAIQQALGRGAAEASHRYPWGDSAVTTMRCLRAWVLFDALFDLPVTEVVETLVAAERVSELEALTRSSLRVLDAARETNRGLRDELAATARERDELAGAGRREQAAREEADRFRRWRNTWAIATVVLVYSVVVLVLSSGDLPLRGDDDPVAELLRSAVWESGEFHLGALGAAATIFGFAELVRRRTRQDPEA
jgi:hypothetical protein